MLRRPNRWGFEFPLLLSKIFFITVAALLANPLTLMVLLAANTAAQLVLVVLLKPFRDPERPNSTRRTEADKLMINGLASQLLNYGLAMMCFEEIKELGALSQATERFASVGAVILLLIQVPQAVKMVLGSDDKGGKDKDKDKDFDDKEGQSYKGKAKGKAKGKGKGKGGKGQGDKEEEYVNPVGDEEEGGKGKGKVKGGKKGKGKGK